MNQNDFDTGNLWRLFLILLNSLVVLFVLAFMYLALEDHIIAYLNKPTFTKEQLADMTERREKARRQERADNWDLVENGIHVKTGLKADPNLQLIIGSCTSCHSAKLITQNRATRQGWKNMIVWMQETQGLTDLGDREPKILDYLAKYYYPEEVGRRKNIDIEAIEWYILDLGEE